MAVNQQELVSDITALLDAFRSASDWQDFAPLEWFAELLVKHELPRDGFDPRFLAALAYSGWFLFCAGSLTPKFHRRRMLVDVQNWCAISAVRKFQDLPTDVKPLKPKPLRKQMRQVFAASDPLVLEIASDYEATLRQTNAFQKAVHGRSWIGPEFAATLCELSDTPVRIGGSLVQTIAWDLRDPNTSELVAADVGYKVGAVYSSMSGFSDRRFPSLGIVQLFAQLELMQSAGVAIWDLGMPMDYKYGLGAGEATEQQWLQVLHECRDSTVSFSTGPTALTSLTGLRQLHSHLVGGP